MQEHFDTRQDKLQKLLADLANKCDALDKLNSSLEEKFKKFNEFFGNIDHAINDLQQQNLSVYLLALNYLPLLQISNFCEFNKFSDTGFGVLQILCDKFGSDKGAIFTPSNSQSYPWYAHSYAQVYEIIFAPLKNRVKYLFECGIGTNNPRFPSNMSSNGKPGASLRVWEKFFANTIEGVYRADIDKEILFNEGKIHTAYMDQTDPASITHFFNGMRGRKFDIMIDDGLHTAYAATTLFSYSIPYLAEDGIYIIEDMATEELIRIINYFQDKEYEVNYILMPRDIKMTANCMVIIRKPQPASNNIYKAQGYEKGSNEISLFRLPPETL